MEILINENYEGMNIRSVLTNALGYSSNLIKKLKFSEEGITVNGHFVTVRYVLQKGDVLALRVEDTAADVSPYTIPVDLPLEVIFEDEYVTAVNKPPNMPAHPSLGHKTDTVANALAYRYGDRPYVFRPVNRLDRDTSGCMLTANSKAASYQMYRAMTEGRIHKTYMAVLDGVPAEKEGRILSYLHREEGSIIRREETDPTTPDAKLAETEYRVIYNNERFSLVEASPITGRTHQLRVQFAGIGCPIVGDTLYGRVSETEQTFARDKSSVSADRDVNFIMIGRHALHCLLTVFPHPASGEEVTVSAPLPDDMRALLDTCFGAEGISLVNL